MTDMTREQIEAIDALAKNASPRPWAVDPDDRPHMHWNNHIVQEHDRNLGICAMFHDNTQENVEGEANAGLITALVNAWPQLKEMALRYLDAQHELVVMRETLETTRRASESDKAILESMRAGDLIWQTQEKRIERLQADLVREAFVSDCCEADVETPDGQVYDAADAREDAEAEAAEARYQAKLDARDDAKEWGRERMNPTNQQHEGRVSDKERGLYAKYYVERLNDSVGKHKDCRFFVLDLDHDKHAAAALRAYIVSCRDEYPALARDLRALLIKVGAP